MNRVLRLITGEVRGILSAVYVLAAFALLSSLLALFRDRLLAGYFGAGAELDLYYAAFRIPDFLFVALGALVSVYVLIPELARRDAEAQKSYINTVFLGFSVLAVCAGAVAALVAPQILSYLFPQFAASWRQRTAVSSRSRFRASGTRPIHEPGDIHRPYGIGGNARGRFNISVHVRL